MSRILIIDGHPDVRDERFVHALTAACAEGARAGGHEVRTLRVSAIEFPLLRRQDDFLSGEPPPAIREAQEAIGWAQHLVIAFPLWLGDMPDMLKGFLEQTLRPGFAFAEGGRGGLPKKLLKGRSARIVVTMGMPAFFYRWYYRAHSVKSLERNILAFCGIAPVRTSIVGMVEGVGQAGRERWLRRLRDFGRLAR